MQAAGDALREIEEAGKTKIVAARQASSK